MGAVVGSNGSNGGTYAIDGYAMTLHYNDGRTERRSFVFLDAGNKHDFYLSGSQYAREDGK